MKIKEGKNPVDHREVVSRMRPAGRDSSDYRRMGLCRGWEDALAGRLDKQFETARTRLLGQSAKPDYADKPARHDLGRIAAAWEKARRR